MRRRHQLCQEWPAVSGTAVDRLPDFGYSWVYSAAELGTGTACLLWAPVFLRAIVLQQVLFETIFLKRLSGFNSSTRRDAILFPNDRLIRTNSIVTLNFHYDDDGHVIKL